MLIGKKRELTILNSIDVDFDLSFPPYIPPLDNEVDKFLSNIRYRRKTMQHFPLIYISFVTSIKDCKHKHLYFTCYSV